MTAFNLGIGYLQDVQTAHLERRNADACSGARTANDDFTTAQINVPAGAQQNTDAVTQIMRAIQQYSPYIEQVTRQACRG